MFLLSDIITYVRRIIKSPSNAVITDSLIIDYINRFWISDVDARIQLFDLKTKYSFQTVPGVDQYNMPLYNVQTEAGGQVIGSYPVYQGFMGPAFINGITVPFTTQRTEFFNMYPNVVQNLQAVKLGNGSSTNYTFKLPILSNTTPLNPPIQAILRGHVDMSGIIATGSNIDPIFGTTLSGVTPTNSVPNIPLTSIYPAFYITTQDANNNSIVISDSGQFLYEGANMPNYGLLMNQGTAPFGYSALLNGYSTILNTVNYITGDVNVTFPVAIPQGVNINVQCFYFQSGIPRTILYYNNTLTLRSCPSQQWLVELDAYLSPSAFLNTGDAIQFGYMAEYIARGAARKILSDTGDVEQFMFYEPLFKEQESLVWKRSQRQFTSTRTQTIYSQGMDNMQGGFNNAGSGSL